MKKLRIGVLGCANIAKRTVIPTIKSIPRFELVAVASRTIEKANAFASQFDCEAIEGYQNLVNRADIDAIYMPLPTGLHEAWVLPCIEAGKHLLIEKSLAMTYESAQLMVKKAAAKGLVMMEDFMFLYHSQHQKIKELIAADEIGEIRSFKSSFGFPPFRDADNFRYNQALGGGALLDAAAYTIRASQLFLGRDLTVAAATLNYPQGKEVDIYGGAFLKGPNGSFAQLAFGFDNYYQCNYEIWGSKGKLIAHKSFTPRNSEKPLVTIEKQDRKLSINLAADDHFVNILNEFIRRIDEKDIEDSYLEILNQSRLVQELRDKSLTAA